jgi:hypothetical protein
MNPVEEEQSIIRKLHEQLDEQKQQRWISLRFALAAAYASLDIPIPVICSGSAKDALLQFVALGKTHPDFANQVYYLIALITHPKMWWDGC